jgi:membrane-associated HD superfamily phosphohydrolase
MVTARQQKIAEGQLDQSPLTLREIDLIKESFANVLTGCTTTGSTTRR